MDQSRGSESENLVLASALADSAAERGGRVVRAHGGVSGLGNFVWGFWYRVVYVGAVGMVPEEFCAEVAVGRCGKLLADREYGRGEGCFVRVGEARVGVRMGYRMR